MGGGGGSSEILHVHGELGPYLGTGTIGLLWLALTEDLQPQLCTTGEQTWIPWRTDAGY